MNVPAQSASPRVFATLHCTAHVFAREEAGVPTRSTSVHVLVPTQHATRRIGQFNARIWACPNAQHESRAHAHNTHTHTHGTTLNVIVPAHSTSTHVLGPALSTSQHVVVPSLSVDPYELEPKHSASLHLGWRTERVHVLVPAHGTSLLVLVPARSAGPTMFVRVGDAGARHSHADDLSRGEALQIGVWDLQGFARAGPCGARKSHPAPPCQRRTSHSAAEKGSGLTEKQGRLYPLSK